MLFILVIIFVSIVLIYRFSFVLFFIGLALISYPYLVSKYNSSANLLNAVIEMIKNWIKTGSLEIINNNDTINKVADDAFYQDIYDSSSDKNDETVNNIKTENIQKVFLLFPKLELYQSWLLGQQHYYTYYLADILQLWKKILNKVVDIVLNPTSYSSNNMSDLLNLQVQLLELIEFINNNSTSTKSGSQFSNMIFEMTKRNREFNINLVKWIKNNNTQINLMSSLVLTDFNVEDYVAPSNMLLKK